MNQVFPESLQPFRARAYPHATSLTEILRSVFPGIPHENPEIPNLPADHMKREPRASWEQFCKFQAADPLDFYGCVDSDGFWFDSSHGFGAAISYCTKRYAPANDFSAAQGIAWMRETGLQLGLSIIHGSMIKRMYEAGLIS